MEAARDRLDRLAGAWRRSGSISVKENGCGCVGNGEHVGPGLAFDGVPAARRLRNVAQREARFGVGAPPDEP